MNDNEKRGIQLADAAVEEEQLIQLTAALADVAMRPVTDLTKVTMADLARAVLRMTAPAAPLSVLPRPTDAG